MKQPLQWTHTKQLGYEQLGEVVFVRMHENSGEYCAQVCSFTKEEALATHKAKDTKELKTPLSPCSSRDLLQPFDVLSRVSKRFNAEWCSSDCSLEMKMKNLLSVSHRPMLFIDLGRIYRNFMNLQNAISSTCRYSVGCNPDPAVLRLLYELGFVYFRSLNMHKIHELFRAQFSVSSRSEVEHLIRNDISLSNVVFSSPMLKLSSVQRILRSHSFAMVTVSEGLLDDCIPEVRSLRYASVGTSFAECIILGTTASVESSSSGIRFCFRGERSVEYY